MKLTDTINLENCEVVLYGLSNYKKTINKIISDLGIVNDQFEIKLILTEGITNAYKHGNKKDVSKPIYIRYKFIDSYIYIRIRDCGNGDKKVIIPDCVHENLFSESGRGLFLIKSLCEKVEFINNTLIIRKHWNFN